ncbi:hypothetical protein BpHYR1_044876 [Brachionus plicatilis]|uniref:Uncharacterized protein n=1 Tax=Brachionus plicatilis TaxID=10195 RepID=A0A3M7R338_BRAPC|nr:hypothetical protein BpHYR1_044876 [Brachionus plicatilis]
MNICGTFAIFSHRGLPYFSRQRNFMLSCLITFFVIHMITKQGSPQIFTFKNCSVNFKYKLNKNYK